MVAVYQLLIISNFRPAKGCLLLWMNEHNRLFLYFVLSVPKKTPKDDRTTTNHTRLLLHRVLKSLRVTSICPPRAQNQTHCKTNEPTTWLLKNKSFSNSSSCRLLRHCRYRSVLFAATRFARPFRRQKHNAHDESLNLYRF